jgi:hypothetical protein
LRKIGGQKNRFSEADIAEARDHVREGPAPDKLAPIKDWLPTQLQRSNAITSRPSSQIHIAKKFDFFILE